MVYLSSAPTPCISQNLRITGPGTFSGTVRCRMATIRKRNGKFQVQVRLKGSPSLTQTFATKTEAVRWARDIEGGRIDRSDLAAMEQTCKITFGELLERYYRDVLSHRLWHRR